MALPMTLIIIAGEIDLSVESMAGLSCAILGFLFAAGVPVQAGFLRARHRGAGRTLQRSPDGAGRTAVARGDPRDAGAVPGPRPLVLGPRASAASPIGSPTSVRASPGRRFRGRCPSSRPGHRAWRRPPRTWIGRELYATGKNARGVAFSGVPSPGSSCFSSSCRAPWRPSPGSTLTARFASARADVGRA